MAPSTLFTRIYVHRRLDTPPQGVGGGYGNWVQTARLTASDDEPRLGFGTSVATDGDLIVVGAGRVRDSEPVYVFSRSDGEWAEEYRLRVNGSRGLGVKVEVEGDHALIGETGGDGAEDNSGLAHLFCRLGSRWVRVAILAASDGSDQDEFGTALALDGNQALAGAYSSDEFYVGSQSGSSYHFDLPVEVEIDIRPGSSKNSINPRSKGLVPVAILTTSVPDGDSHDFDAWDLDPTTITFGPGAAHIAHTPSHEIDVDGDGDIGMLAHFRLPEVGLVCGDKMAILSGETEAGERVYGLDSLVTVGCRRQAMAMRR